MRAYLIAGSLAAVLALGAMVRADDKKAEPVKRPAGVTRMLFIGDGFTRSNGMVIMLKRLSIAAKQSPRVYAEYVASTGATLQRHWRGGAPVNKFFGAHWDVVVIQENARNAMRHPGQMRIYGREFRDSIAKRRAKLMVFAPWAPRGSSDQAWDALADNHVKLAAQLRATLVPVGQAFREAMKANPKFELYMKDDYHPSDKGSFLTACVFYSVLYGKSAEGLEATFVQSLAADDAKALAAAAWRAVDAAKKQKSDEKKKD